MNLKIAINEYCLLILLLMLIAVKDIGALKAITHDVKAITHDVTETIQAITKSEK
jgi:hypothetical protein